MSERSPEEIVALLDEIAALQLARDVDQGELAELRRYRDSGESEWKERAFAARTRALRAEEQIARAREVLKPFAEEAEDWDEMGDTRPFAGEQSALRVSHLRAVLAFLRDTGAGR